MTALLAAYYVLAVANPSAAKRIERAAYRASRLTRDASAAIGDIAYDLSETIDHARDARAFIGDSDAP